ncbi:MAG: hypothetical protein M1433_01955 [Candidatus Parvarchaeota archaeon]|nr:hypothetical protein [Candidatus Parvarchaeota archaeon]
MKKKAPRYDNLLFYISVAAMVILIYSVSFIQFGSNLQNAIFLIGAFILFVSATASKQKVIQALEVIAVVGIVLALLKVYVIYSLITLLLLSLLIVGYLLKIEHYKKEPIGSIGSVGFILLAIGLAFNTGSYPLVTGFALAIGSILISIYAATAFYLYKVRLQIVIAILDIAFAVSPVLLVLNTLGL